MKIHAIVMCESGYNILCIRQHYKGRGEKLRLEGKVYWQREKTTNMKREVKIPEK